MLAPSPVPWHLPGCRAPAIQADSCRIRIVYNPDYGDAAWPVSTTPLHTETAGGMHLRGGPTAPAPLSPSPWGTPVSGPPCWASPSWRPGAWGWLSCSDPWRADLSPRQSFPKLPHPVLSPGDPPIHTHTHSRCWGARNSGGAHPGARLTLFPREAGWEAPALGTPMPHPQAKPPLLAPEPIPCHLVLLTAPLWSPRPLVKLKSDP